MLTFVGYNAGPGRALQWVRDYGDPRGGAVDPIDWIERIPFDETRDYVEKVMENLQLYRSRIGHPLSLTEDLRAWRPARLSGGASQCRLPQPAEASANGDGRVARFHSQDGLSLAVQVLRSRRLATRLPLLCLPGLSRNSRDFIALGRFFSTHPLTPRPVIAVDYRGRGLSESDPDWRNYKPLIEAQDVLAAAAAFGIERAIFVGTSRGGIIAMLLGALRPSLIAGVVLNDIGPVIEGRGLARIKSTLSVKKRTVATWDEAAAALRAAGEAQFPALDRGRLARRLAAAYYGETRRRPRAAIRSRTSQRPSSTST